MFSLQNLGVIQSDHEKKNQKIFQSDVDSVSVSDSFFFLIFIKRLCLGTRHVYGQDIFIFKDWSIISVVNYPCNSYLNLVFASTCISNIKITFIFQSLQ